MELRDYDESENFDEYENYSDYKDDYESDVLTNCQIFCHEIKKNESFCSYSPQDSISFYHKKINETGFMKEIINKKFFNKNQVMKLIKKCFNSITSNDTLYCEFLENNVSCNNFFSDYNEINITDDTFEVESSVTESNLNIKNMNSSTNKYQDFIMKNNTSIFFSFIFVFLLFMIIGLILFYYLRDRKRRRLFRYRTLDEVGMTTFN